MYLNKSLLCLPQYLQPIHTGEQHTSKPSTYYKPQFTRYISVVWFVLPSRKQHIVAAGRSNRSVSVFSRWLSSQSWIKSPSGCDFIVNTFLCYCWCVSSSREIKAISWLWLSVVWRICEFLIAHESWEPIESVSIIIEAGSTAKKCFKNVVAKEVFLCGACNYLRICCVAEFKCPHL